MDLLISRHSGCSVSLPAMTHLSTVHTACSFYHAFNTGIDDGYNTFFYFCTLQNTVFHFCYPLGFHFLKLLQTKFPTEIRF